ncbi:annexin A2 [Synchiropus splendidus]|uniref:annexin A2 n=1 Tax=Synchiropus splendidus TaxID=270530 RepID=UPI00237DDCCA|nr:annexin A2 [Synchiropus splendidus]
MEDRRWSADQDHPTQRIDESDEETAMCWGTLGSLRPFPNFQSDKDVIAIHNAIAKKDLTTLVRILTNRTNSQRQRIAATFEEASQKDLPTCLKKVLSGDLEDLTLELLLPPLHHEASRLQQAMAGLGTNEETLLEILCTRSGRHLKQVQAAYKQLYKKDLEKELRAETSGDFLKLVVALLNKEDVASNVQRDVEALAASLKRKKPDADVWIDILTSRDCQHLNKVFMVLELLSGQELEDVIEKQFSGDFQMGLQVLVQCIKSPDAYIAKRLTSMKAPIVQSILIAHCEEDLLCIRVAFLKLTGTSLYTTLQKHFKGNYLQALLALCGAED